MSDSNKTTEEKKPPLLLMILFFVVALGCLWFFAHIPPDTLKVEKIIYGDF